MATSPTDFNFQEFRILNAGGEMVKAAAQFMFMGYEISFSTMFNPYPTEVCVFLNDSSVYDCSTVAQAIEWCQNNPLN